MTARPNQMDQETSTVAVPQFIPMSAADLDAVTTLERQIYAHPWTRGNFADSLAAGYSAWLMHVRGALVGYALMTLVVDEAQLLNISVMPQQQHLGLGSALLQHLLVVAGDYGATRIYLEVRRSNQAALAFYRRHDFVAVGERQAYYPADQGREDALVLARDVASGQVASELSGLRA
jgi:ribosomal-protein-alanine N-acetyltransferase